MDTVRTDKSTTKDLFENIDNDSAIEIKGSVFTLPVLKIKSTQLAQIELALKQHLSKSLSFFRNAPIVIDLESTKQLQPGLDFEQLNTLLRGQQLVPVAVQKGSLEQHLAAESAGLAILTGQLSKSVKSDISPTKSADDTALAMDESPQEQPNVSAQSGSPVTAPQDTGSVPTKIISQPIRSGQRIYARGCDLIVLAAVNAGAEIMADGNIHIYAPLRGRALAGVTGGENNRIFCHSFEAELVAIAGSYRVFEDTVPSGVFKKPVQIYLRGEQLDIVPIQ
ncbi:MAG: septum site-determining protein MinC [Gammaproteobacteria bacterium]|nr:septum site-determining protein MinC [Gammaproteobacteria bacterium]